MRWRIEWSSLEISLGFLRQHTQRPSDCSISVFLPQKGRVAQWLARNPPILGHRLMSQVRPLSRSMFVFVFLNLTLVSYDTHQMFKLRFLL